MSELLGHVHTLSRAAPDPSELESISAELVEVRRLLEASAVLPALAPLIEEVSGLRDEVASLRRRISLRAASGGLDAVELSEQQFQRLILALDDRFGGWEGRGDG